MSSPTVEKVVENCGFTEGPHWDEETQSLYFVDMQVRSLNRYVPATKKHTKVNMGAHVSAILPVRGQKNKFLVSFERELAVVTWDGESDKVSDIQKLFDNRNNAIPVGTQLNDGKCDPSGRLWIGTMSKVVEGKLLDQTEKKGSLYSYQSGNLKTFVTEVGVSNGLAFNVELKKFYYIDSFKRTVDEFDFDIGSGSIANRKAIFSFNSHELPGSPDGMTIDTDGNLWVAVMAGSRVIKIDPRKPETLLDTVILPTKLVTSVAFGGKKLDELYVTTGKLPTDESTSDDGAIYKITGLNARGFPGVSVIL